jgi:hypothetical protein
MYQPPQQPGPYGQPGYPQLPPQQPQQQPQQQQYGYPQQQQYGYAPQPGSFASAPPPPPQQQYGGQPQYAQPQYAQPQYAQQQQPPQGYQAGYAQPQPQPKVLDAFPSYPSQPPPPPRAPGAAPQPAAQPAVRSGCRDVGFAVAFWVHVLAIAGLAFALGVPAVLKDSKRAGADAGRSPLDFNASLFFRVLLTACAVGAVASTAFIAILQHFASSLIYCALYTSLAMQGALAAAFFALGQVGFGVFMLVLFALQCAYVFYVRDRIAFATAHVKAAVAAVKANRAVFGVALALVLLQAVWVMVWDLASLGVSSAVNGGGAAAAAAASNSSAIVAPSNGGGSNGTGLGGAAVFGMTVSLYWGTQTFMYVSHFIVASVVGSWWFTPKAPSPVASATHRAFTSSFGSLSFGALIVAVLEACKQLARAAQRAAEKDDAPAPVKIMACLCVCIIGCVEGLVKYFNSYAVIFCALTGKGFYDSGKDVMALFEERGWTAVINDDLVGPALKIASLAPAVLAALAGAALTYLSVGPGQSIVVLIAAILSFIVGMCMATIMTGVITSAVRTVFVCFALNPAALAESHPAHFNELVDAWNKFHPAEYSACGYASTYKVAGPAGVIVQNPTQQQRW